VLIETMEGDGNDWSEQPLHLSPSIVIEQYCSWLRLKNPHAVVSAKALLKELKGFGWDGGDHCRERTKRRDRYWLVPKLSVARKRFAAKLGYDPFDEEGE
jgi:hypothetical protein